MKLMKLFLPILLLAACSSGFDRGALSEQLSGPEPMEATREVTDSDIRRVQQLKPQLSLPFRLGIYLIDRPKTSWTEKDRVHFVRLGRKLEEAGICSDVVLISGITAPDGSDYSWGRKYNLRPIRLAAARHGADAVLVVDGAFEVDRYLNPLSLFNITIVGGWIIPGSQRDALYLMRAAMWDVGNEYLYITAQSEGEGNKAAPSFVVEDEPAVNEAKQKALFDLTEELLKRAKRLKG